MFLRSKIIAALTGFLVVGCGSSGTSSTPITPPVELTIPFTSLPQGSFSLGLARSGAGIIPGDGNIYVQIVNQPCLQHSPCQPGDTRKITSVTLDTARGVVTDGPNGRASLGTVSDGTANMALPSFKVADLVNGNVILPGDAVYGGSRIYISMGAPLTQTVNPQGNGYAQTNFSNPSDPNIGIPFDFVEIAYDAKPNSAISGQNTVAFGANLTQVDQFGLPLAFVIKGATNTTYRRGITLGLGSTSGATTRDQIIQNYLTTVSPAFQQLAQTVNGNVVRILSPYKTTLFNPAEPATPDTPAKPAGPYVDFFDSYVDTVWNFYIAHPSVIYDQPNNAGNKYNVSSDGTNLSVTRNCPGPECVGPFLMAKPSTLEVLKNAGALQPGGDAPGAFGALLAASLNRHVADQPSNWLVPSAFYPATPKHDYAQFWHQISILNLAYGFGFDDTADQSSVAILTPSENIASLNVTVGW